MYIDIKKDRGPVYLQVYEGIRDLIIGGHLEEGDRLPSLRALARDLDLSLTSIKSAYLALEEEGYVISIERAGYFVKSPVNLLHLQLEEGPDVLRSPDQVLDFSYGGVDQASFPFSNWQRVFHQVLVPEDPDILSAGLPQGHPPLREAISHYLKISRGIQAQASNIFISSGTGNLFSLIRLILDEDTSYAFEDPGLAWSTPYFRSQVKDPLSLKLDLEGARLDGVRDLDKACLLLSPAHQFPLGMIMSPGRREEVLAWMGASPGRYIIEDDYDSEFKYSGPPLPPLKAQDGAGRVIYIGSFSKSLAPSLRVSYMVLPDDLADLLSKHLASLSSPVSLIIQKALATFLRQGYFDTHLNRMRVIYGRRHELILEMAKDLPHLEVLGSDSGMSLAARLTSGISSRDFLKEAKARGLRIGSVQDFQSDPSKDLGLVILGFSRLDEEGIKKGIKTLGEILENFQ